MKTWIERIRDKKEKRYVKLGFIVPSMSIVLFSILYVMASSVPGTFAWFTSETEASGTIQNAITADLLTIQASDVTYGENCTVSNTLSIKNISELDTTVSVSVVTNNGEKLQKEQHLQPNQTLETSPEELTAILANVCSTDHIEYRIHAFINFVDESFIVAVDPTKMKETPINIEDELEEDNAVKETPIEVESELEESSVKSVEEVDQMQEHAE